MSLRGGARLVGAQAGAPSTPAGAHQRPPSPRRRRLEIRVSAAPKRAFRFISTHLASFWPPRAGQRACCRLVRTRVTPFHRWAVAPASPAPRARGCLSRRRVARFVFGPSCAARGWGWFWALQAQHLALGEKFGALANIHPRAYKAQRSPPATRTTTIHTSTRPLARPRCPTSGQA